MKIAVVGGGISGLVAARELSHNHEVVLFEKNDRAGGHANTVDVSIDGRSYAVDTGFIVFNERNYPGLVKMLAELDVKSQPTDMSFGVSNRSSGLEYGGRNLNTLFAQRKNFAKASFLRFATEIGRFSREASKLVESEPLWGGGDRLPADRLYAGGSEAERASEFESIGEFINRRRFRRSLVDDFLVPFGSSIWSADPQEFLDFPIVTYARFMNNHGLLKVNDRPKWRTVSGGSRTYVTAICAQLGDTIQLSTQVMGIVPIDGGVEVTTRQGRSTFDRVVIAAHSDEALEMLDRPTDEQVRLLTAIRYRPNIATLHTDDRLLPVAPRARSSWNYTIGLYPNRPVVTYWMNRLQSLDCARQILVTLNAGAAVDRNKVFGEFDYHHPVFNSAAIKAQRARSNVQGVGGVYFAGAYWGYGFHEDGVQSALEVVRLIENDS